MEERVDTWEQMPLFPPTPNVGLGGTFMWELPKQAAKSAHVEEGLESMFAPCTCREPMSSSSNRRPKSCWTWSERLNQAADRLGGRPMTGGKGAARRGEAR